MDVGAFFRWMVRALRPMDIDARFPPRKLNLRNSVNGIKSGSCRFWQRTDSQSGSNKFRMVYANAAGRMPWRSNMHGLKSGSCRFCSGLIRPQAQTCCASPTQTPARLANSPRFKSFRCPRWRIKFSLERFSDLSHICLRIQPLKNSAGRVPQAPRLWHALLLKWATSVEKRHWLPISEARLCSACAHLFA